MAEVGLINAGGPARIVGGTQDRPVCLVFWVLECQSRKLVWYRLDGSSAMAAFRPRMPGYGMLRGAHVKPGENTEYAPSLKTLSLDRERR